MADLEARYGRSERMVFRRIHDEMLLVPIKDNVGDLGSIYSLNEVGAFVWEHLDGTRRLLDIKEMMAQEFDVPPQRAETDLCEFVDELQELGAIVAL